MLTRLVAFARGVAGRRRIAAEVDDELRFHVEQAIEDHVARGVPVREARRLALRDLGGVTQAKEAVAAVRALWLDLAWRDARYAIRSLRAAPGFTAAALVVITLSIGAATAVFSVVDAVLLRPLPFDEPGGLVAVGEFSTRSRSDSMKVAPQNFLDWRAQQDVFSAVAAVNDVTISLRREGDEQPETLAAEMVTADFFTVLRAAPLVGRAFTSENEVDGRARVAVISYGLWQRRFGGTPEILTRRLPGVLGDFEIVGVMPPAFSYPAGASEPTAVWVPLVVAADQRVRATRYEYVLDVIGRLRDGVSLAQAQARMEQVTARLAAGSPRWFEDRKARVEPLRGFLTRDVRTWMLLLLGAVAFVMLIASVNVASLMIVRATGRARELGIRAALGASRWDLTRALLMESLVLSMTGAALGVFVAWAGVELLRAAIPAEVPRAAMIAINLRVLSAAAAAALVTGVAFGTAPMLQCAGPGSAVGCVPRERVSSRRGPSQWLRALLVVAEVALAVVLLVGAGLFLASFWRVSTVDLGFEPEHVLTVRIRPLVGQTNYDVAVNRNRDLLLTVLDRIRSVPGVDAAALVVGGLPLRGDLRTERLRVPGLALPNDADIPLNQISADYFRVLKVPLLKGRFFTDADGDGSQPVVLLNDAAARKYFGEEDPVGRTVNVPGPRTIVGVVGNIRSGGPEDRWSPGAFVPLTQSHPVGATLVMRTGPESAAISSAAKTAVWSQFPEVPIPDVYTLDHYLDGLVAQRHFVMLLLACFGLLAIVIAGIGIYGVIGYVVRERTQEIGIRIALGAMPAKILWSVLGRTSLQVAAGLALGAGGSWALAGLVGRFLFQIQPHDPRVYSGAVVVLVLTALAAALAPARRAAHVDPLTALRMD